MKEVTTYLMFDGTCREAMTFYKDCLGAELHLMPFSEAPGEFPGKDSKRVMHARLNKGTVPVLMASDTMPGMPLAQGSNFSVAIACESADEIERLFTSIGHGGKVTMQLHDAFWGARFGSVVDKFGINWMFNFEQPK